ncbi:MAG TPA: hypothetical protein VKB80_32635 [Kofleriaceae bacterium]|nr:hypothetical protein [Kofleriaceae bacterium]
MGTRKTMLASAAALAMAACQPTIGDAPGIGSGVQRPDAGDPDLGNDDPTPDAAATEPPPDAAPGQPQAVTLRQTTSDQILDLHSIACIEQEDDGTPIENRENSYYRVFDLAAENIDGDLAVDSVTIGVESASAPGDASQPATVRLHSLAGELLVANMTEIGHADIQIEPQIQTSLEVPITATAPAGSTLVLELFIPDSADQNRLFFIGSNNLGQTAPGYIRAPSSGCDFIEPTPIEDIGGTDFPDVHIVMLVSGSYVPGGGAGLTGSATPARAAPRRVSVW